MLEEILQTGKTVEEAIEAACQMLGCTREECEWEIIDLPKKGFLGFKNIPAKVKVSFNRPEVKPAAKSIERPIQEKKETTKAKPVQPREQSREQRPIPEKVVEKKEIRPDTPPVISMDPPSEEQGQKAEATKAYLLSVLDAMQVKRATIDTHWEDGSVYFAIQGEGLGVIIGRRGDTLDSLQYLCGLIANRMGGDYLRVTVDCGDYRVKRKATLEALAHKLSEQVLRTNTARTLEPMNPFERRIIHSTVSTIDGVSSTSVGEEPNRRVVITSPTARNLRRGGKGRSDRPQGRRHDERRSPGGGQRRDDRPRDDRRSQGARDHARRTPEATPSVPVPRPPTEAENKPLYGKIDLD